MSYQVRTVYYLGRTVHTFDIDWLQSEPQLLPDTYVTMSLEPGLKERVELASSSFARSGSGQWFVHHTNDRTDEGWDGDVERFRSLQAVSLALLLSLNPNLRFGPILETLSPGAQCSFTVWWRDQLASHNSPFRQLPTYFFDYTNPPSEFEVRTVAIDLMNTWSERRISLVRDRYIRACMADRRDTAVIELAVGLEVLFAVASAQKRKVICSRAAVLGGSNGVSREELYRDIGALYLLRNHVIHEGALPKDLQLANSSSLSIVSTIRNVRRHLSTLIRYVVHQPADFFASWPTTLANLDNAARLLADEFAAYEIQYFASRRRLQ